MHFVYNFSEKIVNANPNMIFDLVCWKTNLRNVFGNVAVLDAGFVICCNLCMIAFAYMTNYNNYNNHHNKLNTTNSTNSTITTVKNAQHQYDININMIGECKDISY